MSAVEPLTVAQKRVFASILVGTVVTVVAFPVPSLTAWMAVITAAYLASLSFRLYAMYSSWRHPRDLVITDEQALRLSHRTLPIYTVLVPAFHEPEVIGDLIESLRRLNYPTDRLDIKLLLEADDADTLAAARRARPPEWMEIVEVPVSEPRTKPKACNVGLQRAAGRLVTIFDAEDRPDPLQLRRAVAAFRQVAPDVACLQAKLAYHNGPQNHITRWFTIEYLMWFSHLLPGLIAQGAPLPLGGTSNHFRTDVLRQLGGWDAYNVTEDADLGIRLHRAGHRTLVLDSTTLEEANSDFVNWMKQRSRWYKGYMQTWLVHMRQPRRLWRDLGPAGFIGFSLFVGGTPLLALLNPLFWALTIVWFLWEPAVIQDLYPPWLYYAAMLCLVVGNLAFWYAGIVIARSSGTPPLVRAAVIAPAYWVMMSIAAVKAALQLVITPHLWEKTVHGLDAPGPTVEEPRRAPA